MNRSRREPGVAQVKAAEPPAVQCHRVKQIHHAATSPGLVSDVRRRPEYQGDGARGPRRAIASRGTQRPSAAPRLQMTTAKTRVLPQWGLQPTGVADQIGRTPPRTQAAACRASAVAVLNAAAKRDFRWVELV